MSSDSPGSVLMRLKHVNECRHSLSMTENHISVIPCLFQRKSQLSINRQSLPLALSNNWQQWYFTPPGFHNSLYSERFISVFGSIKHRWAPTDASIKATAASITPLSYRLLILSLSSTVFDFQLWESSIWHEKVVCLPPPGVIVRASEGRYHGGFNTVQ